MDEENQNPAKTAATSVGDESTTNKLPLQEEAMEFIQQITSGELGNKRRLVIDRLNTIRVAKTKILKHLQILKEKEESGEYSNLDLVHKLVESYDALVVQEREFISLLREVIQTYRATINNVTTVLGTLQKQCQEAPEDDEAMNEKKQLEGKINSELDGLIGGFNTMENMVDEVKKTSLLDEQFKTCIELHFEQKRKMELMHQVHMKEKAAQELAAKELTEHAKKRVFKERSILDRKQKQLERLRKEAARRGISKEQQQPPAAANSSSQLSSTIKVKKTAKQKDNGPVIPDNQRIPTIPQLPEIDPAPLSSENSTDKKDDLRTKISERFASLEARKQRMRLLRMKLNSLEKQKMDNTYDEAVQRVQNLTEMRKQLEEVQMDLEKNNKDTTKNDAGDDLDQQQEDNEENNGKMGGSSSTSPAGGQHHEVDEDNDNNSSASTDELLIQVRRAFNNTFKKFNDKNNQNEGIAKSASIEGAIGMLTDRLKRMETVMLNHTEQLTWIGNQEQSSSSSSAVPAPTLRRQQHEDDIKLTVDRVVRYLEDKFAEDKSRPINEQLGKELTQMIVAESARLYPSEMEDDDAEQQHQNVNAGFATIFGAIVSRYIGRHYAEVEQQLVADLGDAVHSELLFLHLMRSANRMTAMDDNQQEEENARDDNEN